VARGGRKRWRRVLRELYSELSAPEHSRRLLFRPSCRQFVRFPANVYCRDGPPTGSLIPTSATEVRRTPRGRGALPVCRGGHVKAASLTRCARSRVAAGRVRPGSGTSVVRGPLVALATGATGAARRRRASCDVPFLAFLTRSVFCKF
jgi:hypothetical protein